jgi:hypothetical protein
VSFGDVVGHDFADAARRAGTDGPHRRRNVVVSHLKPK